MVDARKDKMGPKQALALLDGMSELIAAKGKKVERIDLRKGKPDERRQAAHELGLLGAKAWRAIPALARALGEADRELRLEAAGALGVVGPKYTVALAQIGDYLSFEERRARAAPPVLALGDGGALRLDGESVKGASPGDAEALARFRAFCRRVREALRPFLDEPPVDLLEVEAAGAWELVQ